MCELTPVQRFAVVPREVCVGWLYYPGTNLASNGGGDVQGGRLYGFDYLGNRTREREYGTVAQATAQGNDWTRSRVGGFNADGGLVRYAVYDKNNDNSLDTALYAYGRDALGKKNFGATGRINVAGDTAWSASRRYTWDGGWVVADSTEVGRRYYAYLGHRRVAEVAEDTAGKWTSRAVLTDHLGTVTGIVGDSGNVEAAYLLDPYGNLEHYAGKYQTLYLMTGKEYVSELAGYEFGARVYDPVMGMWWGRDKAAQFWSSYGSGNNPVNGLDPDGNYTIKTIDGRVGLFYSSAVEIALYKVYDGIIPFGSLMISSPPPGEIENSLRPGKAGSVFGAFVDLIGLGIGKDVIRVGKEVGRAFEFSNGVDMLSTLGTNEMNPLFEAYMYDLTFGGNCIFGSSVEDVKTKASWANSYGLELFNNNVEITGEVKSSFRQAYQKEFGSSDNE